MPIVKDFLIKFTKKPQKVSEAPQVPFQLQKYVMDSLLYCLEQAFERQGLKLSRQAMSVWLLKKTEDWLQPIYDVLHLQLCQETVLHEKEKSAASKSYM